MQTFALDSRKSSSARSRPGGAAGHGLTRRVIVQPKLALDTPGDRFEREADRVADQVMRMTSVEPPSVGAPPAIQRACCDACSQEEERQEGAEGKVTVQRKSAGAPPPATAHAETVVSALDGRQGRPLSRSERAFFEPRFGFDFGRVRIHADPPADRAARDLGALAFTHGGDIYFRSDQLRPESAASRRLLAHELTHTIQQGVAASVGQSASAAAARSVPTIQRTPTPMLQRAAECSLTHLDTECAGAEARCAAIQGSYCTSHYAKPEDVDTLYKNAVKGANDKKADRPSASANLLHYLDGTGSEMVMPVAIFKNHAATKAKLEAEHRDKFTAGGKKRLATKELKPGGPQVEMAWTGTANAFSILTRDDLGLAVGGYTLCSKVKVSAVDKGAGKIQMIFDEWNVQAFDCYNWDPGKGIGMPGVDDNDLCCLENAKRAKHFRIRTDSWKNDDAAAAAVVDLT